MTDAQCATVERMRQKPGCEDHGGSATSRAHSCDACLLRLAAAALPTEPNEAAVRALDELGLSNYRYILDAYLAAERAAMMEVL